MARRVHVPTISSGRNALDLSQAHHLRDVLRLPSGAQVELFDDAGQIVLGTLQLADGSAAVHVEAQQLSRTAPAPAIALTVAAAVPKGDRAEWMLEKLSELGVSRFVPLAARRSVVLPSGTAKLQRWQRIAVESAKQSRRRGVMQVSPLIALHEALPQAGSAGIVLSTDPSSISLASLAAVPVDSPAGRWLFVGPEGGWTDDELQAFRTAVVPAAGLTSTILRIETAAIAGAAILLCAATKAAPPQP